MATTALASEIQAGGTLQKDTTTIAKFSKGVGGKVTASVTAFSAASKHMNGTKQFATSSTDPKIYWTAQAAGSSAPAVSLTASDTSNFSSWSAL